MENEYKLFFYSELQYQNQKSISSNHCVNGMRYTEMMSVKGKDDPRFNHKKRYPDSRLIFVGTYSDIYWNK